MSERRVIGVRVIERDRIGNLFFGRRDAWRSSPWLEHLRGRSFNSVVWWCHERDLECEAIWSGE